MPIPSAAEISFLWDDYRPTRLVELPELARVAKVARVLVKDEGERPFGNFKVLGGMLAGLRAIARAMGAESFDDLRAHDRQHALPRLVCASDGNHGLAVTAAAARVASRAIVYLPDAVSAARARRIAELGGEIVRIHGTYDDAVDAAADAAERGQGLLVSDTSADPDDAVVRDVMDGYALLAGELRTQLGEIGASASHMFVQAGVGGLAAAMVEGLHDVLRDRARFLVVEPESAACVARALADGTPTRITGDLETSAEMLSCGLASAPALDILRRFGARSLLVGEDVLEAAVSVLAKAGGPATTPSGAAGLAGLLRAASDPELRERHALDADSVVLLIVTERAMRAM